MRHLFPVIVVALLLVLGSGWFMGNLVQGVHSEHSQQLLQERLRQLQRDHERWQQRYAAADTLPGERQAAAEALQTVEQLRRLYGYEEELWTYFDALERSLQVRHSYAAERGAVEQRLAQQRQEMARLDALMSRLRPRGTVTPLSFAEESQAAPGQFPH